MGGGPNPPPRAFAGRGSDCNASTANMPDLLLLLLLVLLLLMLVLMLLRTVGVSADPEVMLLWTFGGVPGFEDMDWPLLPRLPQLP